MARARRQPKRILNCIPSREREDDWKLDTAEDSGVLDAAPRVPAKKDLRQTWWKIQDQGSTGSCVGWACADAMLRWHFVKTNRIAQNELISPRFQWMAAKETDDFNTRPTTFVEAEGTSLKAALEVSRKFGAVRDSVLPFATGQTYQGNAKTFYAIAAQLKISMYFNLGRNLENWRLWLATKGPILTRLDVDSTWDRATENKGKLDVYQRETARGGHAIALVGYTETTFIVRNSWGAAWGDKGFAHASVAYAQDAFTEAYGVEP
ncbi:MAG: C1 family peptidase [Actinobacteria bacterium]|nr:C1 family peptidase [Actinomycetota bacterium]